MLNLDSLINRKYLNASYQKGTTAEQAAIDFLADPEGWLNADPRELLSHYVALKLREQRRADAEQTMRTEYGVDSIGLPPEDNPAFALVQQNIAEQRSRRGFEHVALQRIEKAIAEDPDSVGNPVGVAHSDSARDSWRRDTADDDTMRAKGYGAMRQLYENMEHQREGQRQRYEAAQELYGANHPKALHEQTIMFELQRTMTRAQPIVKFLQEKASSDEVIRISNERQARISTLEKNRAERKTQDEQERREMAALHAQRQGPRLFDADGLEITPAPESA